MTRGRAPVRPLLLAASLALPVVALVLGLRSLPGQSDGVFTPTPVPNPSSHEEARQHAADGLEAMEDFAINTFPTLGLRLRDLDRANWAKSYAIEHETLADAARAADLVVRVRVKSITFTPLAETTAEVIEYIKGSGPAEVVFEQDATVAQLAEGHVLVIDDRVLEAGDIVVVEGEVYPLLVEDDEAVLFLEVPDGVDSALPVIIPGSGWYRLGGGRVVDIPYTRDPSVRAARGLSVADLTELVRAAGD